MLSAIFLLFVLAATSYAAYLDLKTTEVPDSVSLLIGGGSILFYLYHSITLPMLTSVDITAAYLIGGVVLFTAAVGTFLRLYRPLLSWAEEKYDVLQNIPGGNIGPIAYADISGGVLLLLCGVVFYLSYLQAGVTPVLLSVLAGTFMFALGWSMYLTGMWGGADAFVLGAVGYAFPYLPAGFAPPQGSVLPVPVSLLMLVFTVGAIYSVVYAVYVAFRDGEAITTFWNSLREQRHRIAVLTGGYLAVSLGAGYILHRARGVPMELMMQNAVIFLGILLAMLVLYHFLKVVEDRVMRQEISVDALEPGDVLADELEEVADEVDAGKIVGITPEQVELIREHYETVEIRTGVRFIVAFPIAIILLVLYGDPIYLLSGLI